MHKPGKPPGPPPPKKGKKGGKPPPKGKKGKKARDFGGFKIQALEEYEAHAAEVKKLVGGKDFVEVLPAKRDRRPPAFDRLELGVVRSWVQKRPLEPVRPAAALVAFPRMWNTKRGRYTHFKAPGALGSYAILRARPTF
jgi:hypothetical protein